MNRIADIALASCALVGAAPALAVAAAAIALLDGRPVLFVQERVGRSRRSFRVLKLRTMREGRPTPVGTRLRGTGLDELPQLVNVLRGEMSLVGPRPLTAADVTRLGWDDPRYDARWSVRPGITGPAQLQPSGRCDARVSWVYDRAYVRHPQGAARDLSLLAATAVAAIVGKRRTKSLLRSLGYR
jgi:lipopolysaccharide/colanic/teichoic acid biosynthesis glycosyltransferase